MKAAVMTLSPQQDSMPIKPDKWGGHTFNTGRERNHSRQKWRVCVSCLIKILPCKALRTELKWLWLDSPLIVLFTQSLLKGKGNTDWTTRMFPGHLSAPHQSCAHLCSAENTSVHSTSDGVCRPRCVPRTPGFTKQDAGTGLCESKLWTLGPSLVLFFFFVLFFNIYHY